MSYIILAVAIIAVIAFYFIISHKEKDRITKSREVNQSLPNPDHKQRCPHCASLSTYEILKKRLFSSEVIESTDPQYRCMDCNFSWKVDKES